MINNDKNKQKLLRQRLVSSFLTLAYIIPVVAGDETHVDKPKKSTSSWIRTGLELLLGAGCVGGVIREFQNRNTIKSRDEKILKLTQPLEEQSTGLTEEQQQELKTLKALIEKVYGEEYTKYLTITDGNVEYKDTAILTLPEASTLQLNAEKFDKTKQPRIVQIYLMTKQINISEKKPSNIHQIPPEYIYLSYLLDYEKELCSALQIRFLRGELKSTTDIAQGQNNLIKNIQEIIYEPKMQKKLYFKSVWAFLLTYSYSTLQRKLPKNILPPHSDSNIHHLYDLNISNISEIWLKPDKEVGQTAQKFESNNFVEWILYCGLKTADTIIQEQPSIPQPRLKNNFYSGLITNSTTGMTLSTLYEKLTPLYVLEHKNDLTPNQIALIILSLKFVATYLQAFNLDPCGGENYMANFNILDWDELKTDETLKLDIQTMWNEYNENAKSLGCVYLAY